MILVHCHNDYYGPQLVGVYSDLDEANNAIMCYLQILRPPVWSKRDIVGVENWASIRVDRTTIEFNYYEVELNANLKEIQS